ncbi:hypothetical protein ACTXMG_07880 [Corynebacterium flavescens]|uniref:hypothetical protein n=1 Tax=Corynebacterium flavescens TaxID=28028 RepID=UPI003FD65006
MAYFREDINNETFFEHICRTADALFEANVDERQVYEAIGKFWDLRRSEIQIVIQMVNQARLERTENSGEY